MHRLFLACSTKALDHSQVQLLMGNTNSRLTMHVYRGMLLWQSRGYSKSIGGYYYLRKWPRTLAASVAKTIVLDAAVVAYPTWRRCKPNKPPLLVHQSWVANKQLSVVCPQNGAAYKKYVPATKIDCLLMFVGWFGSDPLWLVHLSIIM